MAYSLMASQTLILQNSTLISPNNLTSSAYPLRLSFSLSNRTRPSIITASSSSTIVVNNPSTKTSKTQNPPQSLLTGSTRTVTTLIALAVTASKLLAHRVFGLGLQLKAFHGLPEPLIRSAGPAFFAAMRDVSTGTLNTPFTVVAAGMAKWLDIYSGVLMVRVLLSWFPNIPWDRQPLSAIRDLCDPYLNLFRNIIPPIFDTLDISPLLAFAVLGTLGSILKSSKGGF